MVLLRIANSAAAASAPNTSAVSATNHSSAQALQLRAGGLQLGQYPARAAARTLPGRGQRHLAGRALHQREPDLVLEPADLLGQRRLGDVLARRRRVKFSSSARATR